MDSRAHDTMGPLPENSREQEIRGLQMTAFQNMVHSLGPLLEQEIRRLQITNEEQRDTIGALREEDLQKKNSDLEVQLVESQQRSQQLAEENKELFKMVNTLKKQITRPDFLKQAVMSSLSDDQIKETELGSDARLAMSEDFLKSSTPLTHALAEGGPPVSNRELGDSNPQLGEQYSGAPAGGMLAASPESPTSMSFEAPSPSAGSTGSPVVDGKQFFQQARSRISHEAFNQLMTSIKRMNNKQQTNEDTLGEARRIFGPEMNDLYKDFETLLNSHGM